MKRVIQLILAATLSVLTVEAFAQSYPSKPIKILVPYSVGGTTDIMARALQVPMQASLGQPIIVENKPGASGAIAMRFAAQSTPDGYTVIFVNNGQLAVTPVVQKDAGYDPIKDYAAVGMISTAAMYVVINADVPASDLKSFIEYVRSNPGKIAYATAGPGSFGHLSSELFASAAGLKMLNVPYKGQAPTLNAVLSGEVKLLITSPSSAMTSNIASGKLKLLAVGSEKPWPLTPGTPTVSTVLPGYEAESWFALLAPAGTPPAVVSKLNNALNAALSTPEMKKRFEGFGLEVETSTPEELRARIDHEVKVWGDVIRKAGIQIH
jgi:tripartite-type tricarboxylate transporter receptor subunit TctC